MLGMPSQTGRNFCWSSCERPEASAVASLRETIFSEARCIPPWVFVVRSASESYSSKDVGVQTMSCYAIAGQFAPSADAFPPRRLRQPRPAISLTPAGRTVSAERKRLIPNEGSARRGRRSRQARCSACRSEHRAANPPPWARTRRGVHPSRRRPERLSFLLQIVIGGNIRQHRRLQCVDHSLRGYAPSKEPGKKADDGDEPDRQHHCLAQTVQSEAVVNPHSKAF